MRPSSRSGQSLIDVLIASGVGAILLVGALAVLSPALRGSTDAQYAQTGASLARGLQDALRSYAGSNWNALAALPQGSSNRFYLAASGSSTAIATGTESVSLGSLAGLVSRWKLDESSTATAANSGGGGDGTGAGGLTTSSTCHLAGCWGFNGSNAYVSAPAISGLTAVQSVTFWVNKTSDGYVVDMGGNNNWVQVLSGKIRAGSTPGGGYWDSNANLTSGVWYFVAVTRDASGVQKIYLNGVLDRTDTMTATSTPGAVTLGRYGSAVQYLLTGHIDDIRIYGRALSAAEVADAYAATVDADGGIYTRSFYLEPVRRTSGGAVTPSGGYVDPSTLQAVIEYRWPRGTARTISTYLTRSQSRALVQDDWTGGPGLTTPTTNPGNQFDTSSGISYDSYLGSITISLP